jgi:hypothetical protein
MSEINEEVAKISEAGLKDDLSSLLTENSVKAFCDWLCGLTDISLSSGMELAKFAVESMQKGVPEEDVNEFLGGKLKDMIIEDLKKIGG